MGRWAQSHERRHGYGMIDHMGDIPGPSRAEWLLTPELVHLNHGSFGATPRMVLDAQSRWREQLEADPTGFLVDRLFGELDAVRLRLAGFLGADADGLVFVPNATTGVNVALRALISGLSVGDEVLVTDHTYNACRQATEVLARRVGARVVVAAIPFPLRDRSQAVRAVVEAVTERTRIAIIDHVTSPTALVLPVEEIVAALEPRVAVIVDAAHAPGMVPLDLSSSRASFITGNLHKWVMAPKGAAFLSVRADRRDSVDPLVLGHGVNATARPDGDRLRQMFDWPGTFDPTAWLSVAAALEFGDRLPGGWPAIMDRNRSLALEARHLIIDALGIESPAPDDMTGSMAALPLERGSADALRRRLRDFGFVVPVVAWPDADSRVLRVSAALYNRIDDYRRLVDALGPLVTAG